MSLQERYDYAVRQSMETGYSEEIPLGNVKDFTPEDLENFVGDIMIHSGIITYTGNVSRLHQMVAASIGNCILNELNATIGPNFYFSTGSPSSYVNELGCHSKWNKVPDFSVIPDYAKYDDPNFRFENLVPIEVAYRNESLFKLIVEGFGWVNDFQPFTYSTVLLKIIEDPSTKSHALRILVIMKFNRLVRKSPQLFDTCICSSGSIPDPCWNSWISSKSIEDYFDYTITSEAFDDIRAGKWKAFPILLLVFNPETRKAERVFVNVIELLLKCSRLF